MTRETKIRGNVDELLNLIRQGRLGDGLQQFYAVDVIMQENGNEPTRGRDANLAREKEFLAKVKTWNGFDVKSVAVDGNLAFIECVLDFVSTDDERVVIEQVSVQRWQEGKIVNERFYYDPSGGQELDGRLEP